MPEFHERFPETASMHVTNWHGIKVKVIIQPDNGYSATSQMILDHRQFDDLKYLKEFPLDLDYKSPAWQEWMHRRDIAMKTVNTIAEKIAYDVCHFLAKSR